MIENSIYHQSPRFDINGFHARPFTVKETSSYRPPRH